MIPAVTEKSLSLNERLTIRCVSDVQRRGRGSGVTVNPVRVRQARIAAGLSLAQLAGDDISRTFVYLVEQGRSRPSQAVLELIAHRTGKPISYFLRSAEKESLSNKDLAAELSSIATHVRRFVAINQLTKLEREAMSLIELSARRGAALVRAVQTKARR